MVSARTFVDAWRALAFLLLYGLLATGLAQMFSPYTRVGLALVGAVAVFAAMDLLPGVARGEFPSLDTDGMLYSVRGVVLLVLFVLVMAVTLDGLRAGTGFGEATVTFVSVVVAIAVVFGPVVGYYWRRSLRRAGTV